MTSTCRVNLAAYLNFNFNKEFGYGNSESKIYPIWGILGDSPILESYEKIIV
jgi:hypothetical protein